MWAPEVLSGLLPTMLHAGQLTFACTVRMHACTQAHTHTHTHTLGLSDTTVLAIYHDILKESISRYFVINYRDTMPVHYCC